MEDWPRTSVLVVGGPRPLLAGAIAVALDSDAHLELVGGPCLSQEAVDEVARLHPRVALVDVRGLSPLEAGASARGIIEASPFTRVVLIAEAEVTDLVVVEGARAGAAAVFDEDHDVDELARHLVAIGEGRTPSVPADEHSYEQAERSIEHERELRRRIATLTEREGDILSRLCEGTGTAGIAASLGISPRTVETHVHHLLTKLGVRSRLEAVTAVTRPPHGSPLRGTT